MAAYSVSIDGGRTFADMGVPPVQDGEWGDAGDPVLAVDRAADPIYYVATSERHSFRGVPFWESVDQGVSFIHSPSIHTNIASTDYPWIAVDDWDGTGQHDVYVIISGSYTNSSPQQWLTVSTDGSGGAWTDPAPIGDTSAMMPQMVVGSDHVAYDDWFKAFIFPALAVNPSTSRSNHLYVAYLDCSTNTNSGGSSTGRFRRAPLLSRT